MPTIHRLTTAAAITAATAAAPALLALTTPTIPTTTHADCTGGINVGVLQEGAPVTTNCSGANAPAFTGGAPSEGALSACSGIPGCLSQYYYGPGNVQVPTVDTTVHQSQ